MLPSFVSLQLNSVICTRRSTQKQIVMVAPKVMFMPTCTQLHSLYSSGHRGENYSLSDTFLYSFLRHFDDICSYINVCEPKFVIIFIYIFGNNAKKTANTIYYTKDVLQIHITYYNGNAYFVIFIVLISTKVSELKIILRGLVHKRYRGGNV